MRLEGWINVDIAAQGRPDVALDARERLPFADASMSLVYAEHFLEHLDHDAGILFLTECYRLLLPGSGVVRVSTPNLDWVWRTHYRFPAEEEARRLGAIHLNRAFHGWGHRFLYNDVVLADSLRLAGFSRISFFAYGLSDVDGLRGVEQHEINDYRTTPDCPDVVIAQGYKTSPCIIAADGD
jgi:hypothetical protein